MSNTKAEIEIRRYRDGDGQHVAKHIREPDRREIMFLIFTRPWPAIRMTVAHAEAKWTATRNGEVACIFGINRKTAISDIGVPWLIGTPVMDKEPIRVMRESRKYFDRMALAFPKMENWVMAENTRAVRWLSWLGFDMSDPMPIGVAGSEYIRFSKGL